MLSRSSTAKALIPSAYMPKILPVTSVDSAVKLPLSKITRMMSVPNALIIAQTGKMNRSVFSVTFQM